MKCKCCGTEINAGVAICSECGVPTLVGGSEQDVADMISDYRKSLIGDTSVWLKIYHYKTDNINEPETETIIISDAMSLVDGNLHWCGTEFEKLESEREIEIEIFIKKGSENKSVVLTVKPDKKISHSRIGIQMESGFNIRLAVGDKKSYILSNAVSLIK